jgi:amino acid permease
MDNDNINVSKSVLDRYANWMLFFFITMMLAVVFYGIYEIKRVGEYASEFFSLISMIVTLSIGVYISSILGSKLFGVNQKEMEQNIKTAQELFKDNLAELSDEEKSKPFDKED